MMQKRHLIPVLALMVAGCSHTQTPAIEVRTVEVQVPVAVPCVDESDIPAEPGKVGDELNGDAAHDADILASVAIELRQWGRELRALIEPGCTRP